MSFSKKTRNIKTADSDFITLISRIILFIQSTDPLIRTIKRLKNLFEMANIRIIGQSLLGSDVQGTKRFVRIRPENVRIIRSSN